MQIDDIRMDSAFQQRLPATTPNELDALVDSIARHGIVVPLIVTTDGLLIDGHRRLEAARRSGLKQVPVQKLDVVDQGGWAKTVAVVVNLRRRHLNEAQRADLSSSLLRIERAAAKRRQAEAGKRGEEGGRGKKKNPSGNGAPKGSGDGGDKATARAAAAVGVSRKTLERVERVKKADPQLARDMLAGQLSIAGAARKLDVAELKARSERDVGRHSPGLIRDIKDVGGRYRCIVADPPWEYTDSGTRGAAAGHYPTLSLDKLAALPVGQLVHKEGGHLWLWITWPKIRDGHAHRLLHAWAFDWVGEVLWVKPGIGTGRYIRGTSEVLILGVKGKLRKLLRDNIRGIIEAPRGRHSQKPELARQLISSASPGPYIELFARTEHPGWDRWGLEA